MDTEQQTTCPPEAGAIDVVDLCWILAVKKRLLGWALLAGLAAGAAVAFLLPDMYTATAVIMAPQQQQSILTALAGQLGQVNLSAKDLGLKNPADLYVGILGGRTIADEIIQRFELRKVYGKDTLEDTRKKLAKRTTLEAGKDTLIKIEVDDTDPARAAAMANAYVDGLQSQNSRLALSEAAQRRLFFEQQLEAEKKALAEAEGQLKAMQDRTGMLHLTGQIEASIRTFAQTRAEIAAREVLLQRLRSGATDQNPEVVRLETELGALRRQLAALQSAAPQAGDPLIPTRSVPAASLEYVRTLRDLRYHEALFELLVKQYEAARIDEAKQAPVVQVVDRAVPPDKRSGPWRSIIIAVSGFLFLLAAAAYALAGEGMRRMQADPVRSAKMAEIRRLLRFAKA
jgi:tyrosine-protein kinase Etk/Wzc